MCNRIAFLVASCLLVSTVFPASAALPADEGLAALWNFDAGKGSIASDTSGRNHHARINMGRQLGVASEFLYRFIASYKDAWALTLPHDMPVRPIYCVEDIELASRVWRVMDEFGRKQAEWVPYWQDSDLVTVEPAGCLISLYRHPRNGVLVVVSNLQAKRAEVKLQLNCARLGLPTGVNARDAMSGKPVDIKDGLIALTQPSLGWKLIWVRR